MESRRVAIIEVNDGSKIDVYIVTVEHPKYSPVSCYYRILAEGSETLGNTAYLSVKELLRDVASTVLSNPDYCGFNLDIEFVRDNNAMINDWIQTLSFYDVSYKVERVEDQ